jgi:hypothetical protein
MRTKLNRQRLAGQQPDANVGTLTMFAGSRMRGKSKKEKGRFKIYTRVAPCRFKACQPARSGLIWGQLSLLSSDASDGIPHG